MKYTQKLVGYILGLALMIASMNAISRPAWVNGSSTLNKEASYALIKRILPKFYDRFVVEFLEKENDKDVFELESKDGKIILRGNHGISVASALNFYLKNYAHCDISWNGNNLNLLNELPVVPAKVHQATPYKYRHYFNYCTFNYTAAWWNWERWQQEIDFMALNGINMPLAMTGQNALWYRVYKGMGFTDKDMDAFFSGPAYFMWFWAGNLDGWGGPLPQSWMKSHEELQKKILTRERELGMTPVLPAFTGHVPPAFKDRFPEAKLQKTNWEGRFADTYILDPKDPMFQIIGRKFIEEQTKTFGTDHLYGADTFNEMYPPSNDVSYLAESSNAVYKSMATADPKAVWVMQGWTFWDKRDFWKPGQLKSYLNAVPDNQLIVLDLWSEVQPIWDKTDAYYGKQWIWCMLHNFGGKINMFGNMDKISIEPSETFHNPKAGNMVGIGVVPEGIEQNPAMYALMLDHVWRDKVIDADDWVKAYVHRRYGQKNTDAERAWNILHYTVYSTDGGHESIITGRPTFKSSTDWTDTERSYKLTDLIPAWDHLIRASANFKNVDGFQYDLVDLSRQILADYASTLQQNIVAAYRSKNQKSFQINSSKFLELIKDMDHLLATRKDFLLGKWLNDAKRWGTNDAEKALYEKNARNLITLWGDKDASLHEYANKQWSGLLTGFYLPRWQYFFKHVAAKMNSGQKFSQEAFDKKIKVWEWNWVQGRELYNERPEGDPVVVSKMMYQKYAKMISDSLTRTSN
jgi:alpha-N-acetylglucosaminidase